MNPYEVLAAVDFLRIQDKAFLRAHRAYERKVRLKHQAKKADRAYNEATAMMNLLEEMAERLDPELVATARRRLEEDAERRAVR